VSEALPDGRCKAQERSPEEEAAHLLKKAAKQEEKAKKRAKRRLSLVAITLSVFLAWLGSTVFVTIHAMLASELGVSHARVKLALASYSVALIMTAVAGGRLADILGRKRMFISAPWLFRCCAPRLDGDPPVVPRCGSCVHGDECRIGPHLHRRRPRIDRARHDTP
jgi:hypothetical protein